MTMCSLDLLEPPIPRREVLLEQKLAMMSVESGVGQEIQSSNQESIILDKNTPSPEISGVINPKDNREYLEYPAQSPMV